MDCLEVSLALGPALGAALWGVLALVSGMCLGGCALLAVLIKAGRTHIRWCAHDTCQWRHPPGQHPWDDEKEGAYDA